MSYAEPIKVDMIVEGDYVVPMTTKEALQRDASVVVDAGQIVTVGDRESIAEKYSAEIVLTGKDRIVLPGIVNGHTHAAMTLFRGMADDLELMEWAHQLHFSTGTKVCRRRIRSSRHRARLP